MNDNYKDQLFLGRGWAFPPSFNPQSGKVEMSQAEKDIKESLHILLSTALGERIMQPKFGCNLNAYVFDGLDNTTQTMIKDMVETAIIYHEPRIDLDRISVQDANPAEGKFELLIEFIIRSTNSRSNMVFPFYTSEGNNL
jgi:phage baseplate assembly protein W